MKKFLVLLGMEKFKLYLIYNNLNIGYNNLLKIAACLQRAVWLGKGRATFQLCVYYWDLEIAVDVFWFQNLGEAEYVVAVFMYMRLMGYPAEKISILTTYNGQKHLIRDVINQRCSKNPFIGRPYTVSLFICFFFFLNFLTKLTQSF